jgi:hypothetical protein
MIRRLIVMGALALALLATSVPAANAATEPGVWAPKFCKAFQKWQKTVTTESEKATSVFQNTADGDLQAVKDEFVSFLGKDVTATNTVISSIKKAGAPDAKNGKAIQKKIVEGFQAAADIFSQAKADAAELSATDPTAFVTDATQIKTDLDGASSAFSGSFSKAEALDKDGTVGSALEEANACSFLFSSGS